MENIAIGLYGTTPEPVQSELKNNAIRSKVQKVLSTSDCNLENTEDEINRLLTQITNFLLFLETKVQNSEIDRSVYLQLKMKKLTVEEVTFIMSKYPEYDGLQKCVDDGLITEQLYPEIIKAALPVVGRSGDILRPELKQVKDSVKQMIKNEGFSIPGGTEDQVALLAMMFGGQPTKYPGVTDVGMNFLDIMETLTLVNGQILLKELEKKINKKKINKK